MAPHLCFNLGLFCGEFGLDLFSEEFGVFLVGFYVCFGFLVCLGFFCLFCVGLGGVFCLVCGVFGFFVFGMLFCLGCFCLFGGGWVFLWLFGGFLVFFSVAAAHFMSLSKLKKHSEVSHLESHFF